ncbi:hypothetical protein MRB53_038961 [Persea americana]|nr:hypothetical protein MRB53_038961 [Persea americana]
MISKQLFSDCCCRNTIEDDKMSTVMYRQSLRRATIATSKIIPRQQCSSQRFASTFTSRATKRARSAVSEMGDWQVLQSTTTALQQHLLMNHDVSLQEPSVDSPEALEEEASQQGAFNEETGEINWDCPCLGGMADGPCGEQFKAAFSCFVFSKEEPKGVDCIEHFKTMQNCFREHPEIYGAELDPDEEDQIEAESEAGPAHAVQVCKRTN